MAIIDMLKVQLVAMEQDKEKIMKSLQEQGYLEVVESEPVAEEWFAQLKQGENHSRIEHLERGIADLEFALRFLNERTGDVKKPKGLNRISDEDLISASEKSEEAFEIVEMCRQIEAEENELKSKKGRLQADIEKIRPWENLEFPLEEIKDTSNVGIRAGSILTRMAPAFEEEIARLNNCQFEVISTSKDITAYLLVCHKKEAEELWDIARKFDFNFENFEGYVGIPKAQIEDLEKRISGLEEQKVLLTKQTEVLAENIERIKLVIDALQIELSREMAASKLLNSGKTFALQGWIRYNEQQSLEKMIQEITEVYHLEFKKPEDDEPFPVYTVNNSAVTPYEMVTNLYSVPYSRGIDPNAVVAPFHSMFMGLMIGDVAYGLIMAIAATIFIKIKDPQGGMRKLVGVIRSAGIFSILWGIVFGSYFGDFGAKLGFNLLLVNPIEQPLIILGLCLGLGFIHIFVGMGVKAYMYIKEGKFLDAIYDVVFWYLLLIGLPLMATPYGGIGKWLALVGAVGVVLTNGREKKNIFGKIAGGVGSLYGITGYLSDILSYSRLFALMLSGMVVSMVMNQLAAMLGTNIIGFVFAILIFLGGHAFNLFISGLGAFVHGSRLVYVEFFSKFFMGGGHIFEPLSKETKYNRLV